jgi:hypothetical protein
MNYYGYSLVLLDRMMRGGYKYTWGPKGIRAGRFWAATKSWNRPRRKRALKDKI